MSLEVVRGLELLGRFVLFVWVGRPVSCGHSFGTSQFRFILSYSVASRRYMDALVSVIPDEVESYRGHSRQHRPTCINLHTLLVLFIFEGVQRHLERLVTIVAQETSSTGLQLETEGR